MKISATIITLNEEHNIADCLASLDFLDEIVVVDSGSCDKTEAICRANPRVRFERREWLGFGRQKNLAAELATHDWVFNIDADERISPELRESIQAADTGKFSVFRMARENYFGGRWIRQCGWYPDFNFRFYNRTVCRFSERSVHESLEHTSQTGTLNGNLRHYTYSGISDYIIRMDRYSTLAAGEIVKAGGNPAVVTIMYKPLATFLKMYLLKRGIAEGYTGLLLSALYAQYTFLKYAKARELAAGNSRKDDHV
jgi:glycosyltransferase involved in cell wall biosynthesis